MIDLVLLLHVVGAAVLFGTGTGIAFFMVMAHRTRDPAAIAHVAGTVVTADFLFTASAVVAQPLTGTLLALDRGYPLGEGGVFASLLLYGVTGLFWLPVVFIQMRMRDLARDASAAGQALPAASFRLYRIWFAFGFPAFGAVVAI